MTLKEELQEKLEKFPQFRERRFRAKFISLMALRKCGLDPKWDEKLKKYEDVTLSVERMADYAKYFDSLRHEYDAVQKENPPLRGKDYEDGKIYAQKKQMEFGYYSGYHEDIKKLETLV